MTGPRPSLDQIVASVDRPSLDEIVNGPSRPSIHERYQKNPLSAAQSTRHLAAGDLGEAKAADKADTYSDRFGAMAIRAASNLWGGAPAMAAVRSHFTGEPVSDAASANEIDAEEAGRNAPGVTIPEAIPVIGGGRITAADLIAGTGVKAVAKALPSLGATGLGATYVGGLRASRPVDESLGERAKGTAIAAATGAVPGLVGKAVKGVMRVGELAGAANRSSKAVPFDDNLVSRDAARSASAGPAYDAFRSLGTLPETPTLNKILDLPIVRAAGERIRGTNPDLQNVAPTDARLLASIYEMVGDKAFSAEHTFDPTAARLALHSAIEQAAQKAGGSFSDATRAFAEPSGQMDALTRGKQALRYAAAPRGTPVGNVLEDSPAAFKRWIGGEVSPGEQAAATEGILGELRQSPKTARFGIGKLSIPYGPSRALSAAPDLLSRAGSPSMFTRVLETFGDQGRSVRNAMRPTEPDQARGSTPWDRNPNPPPPQKQIKGSTMGLPTEGEWQVGPGIPTGPLPPRRLTAVPERLRLKGSTMGIPTEGTEPVGPPIPMKAPFPTDAEMFGSRIPPSRRLVRGPIITPEPLPSTVRDLLKALGDDPETRRRLDLPKGNVNRKLRQGETEGIFRRLLSSFDENRP